MANKKITELTEETSPQGADLLALVDDVSAPVYPSSVRSERSSRRETKSNPCKAFFLER